MVVSIWVGGGGQLEISALRRAPARAQGIALYFVECNNSACCQTAADTVRERLDRTLVVWLPEEATRHLARRAPDFFDGNSGAYVFRSSAN